MFIEAPRQVVWELVADVKHHPDWWPDVVEVEGDEIAEGCVYREVIKVPFGGTGERNFLIEDFDDPSRFRINCTTTGGFVDLTLTEAQGGCFVDASVGMVPKKFGMRIFDSVMGPRYFRNWLEKSLDAMNRVATDRPPAA
jgi:uncharacterized protein YndB with AHSA1/START domain